MKPLMIPMILMLSGALMAGDLVKTAHLKLNAGSVQELIADCASGSLIIRGVKDGQYIEVDAEIEAERVHPDDAEEWIERHVRLSLEQRGSRAYLVSDIRDSWSSSRGARINLIVKVPWNIDLDIEDGSGSTEISGIRGRVIVDDGSGSMDISDIEGNVEVDDGSGSLEIRDIRGDLIVDDGSGSLSIRNVTGSVRVSDGSGSIDIDGVEKDLHIRESGSGGLSIHNIKGQVTLKD